MKIYFILLITIFSLGCKGDIELAMERGIQYYEWDMIEKAVLEFKSVIHQLNSATGSLNNNQIKLLARAHHNLAVAYAKKEWFEEALMEARKAFDLVPTDKNRRVIDLIIKKSKIIPADASIKKPSSL